MNRFTLCLIALVLVACGGSAEPPPTEQPPAQPVAQVVANTPTPLPTPVPINPTATPAPTNTSQPEPAEPVATAEGEGNPAKAKWGVPIGMFALLSAVCDSTLELAQQKTEAGLNKPGLEILAIAAVIDPLNEIAEKWEPAPDQAEISNALITQYNNLKGVMGRWFNEEITAAEVPQHLDCTPIAPIGKAIGESALADGLTAEEMAAMLEELSQAFQE